MVVVLPVLLASYRDMEVMVVVMWVLLAFQREVVIVVVVMRVLLVSLQEVRRLPWRARLRVSTHVHGGFVLVPGRRVNPRPHHPTRSK